MSDDAVEQSAPGAGKSGADRKGWLRRGAVGRGAISAGIATSADFILATTLVMLSVASPSVGTFLGFCLGGLTNFLINRHWAYGAGGSYGRQAWRYVGLSVTSAGLNVALVWGGMHSGTPYVVVWVIARFVVFATWTHRGNRDFVFADSTSAS